MTWRSTKDRSSASISRHRSLRTPGLRRFQSENKPPCVSFCPSFAAWQQLSRSTIRPLSCPEDERSRRCAVPASLGYCLGPPPRAVCCFAAHLGQRGMLFSANRPRRPGSPGTEQGARPKWAGATEHEVCAPHCPKPTQARLARTDLRKRANRASVNA